MRLCILELCNELSLLATDVANVLMVIALAAADKQENIVNIVGWACNTLCAGNSRYAWSEKNKHIKDQAASRCAVSSIGGGAKLLERINNSAAERFTWA